MKGIQNAERGMSLVVILIILAVLGGLVLIVNSSLDSAREKGREARERAEQGGSAQATNTASATSGGEKLEVLSFSCTHEYGYARVTGQVKNISNESMKDVLAVGSWYTADGTFIKSDDALVEYNPILPGQTSPFETMSTYNPAMSKCQIEFKEFFGGTIRFKRSSQ